MPPPRKVDLLPSELRRWLQEALKERGFSGYEDLAEDLNFKLEEEGLELRIGKSALHAYGQDFQHFAAMQETAQDEIKAFMQEMNAADEVDVTSALFQQLTTIQWRLQKALFADPEAIDPRGMKELTTALNNLIRSTDLRDKMLKDFQSKAVADLEKAVDEGELQADYVRKAKEIMGFG